MVVLVFGGSGSVPSPPNAAEVHFASLEMFRHGGDVSLRDVVSGHSRVGLEVDLGNREVFSYLNDCMALLGCESGGAGYAHPHVTTSVPQ